MANKKVRHESRKPTDSALWKPEGERTQNPWQVFSSF